MKRTWKVLPEGDLFGHWAMGLGLCSESNSFCWSRLDYACGKAPLDVKEWSLLPLAECQVYLPHKTANLKYFIFCSTGRRKNL